MKKIVFLAALVALVFSGKKVAAQLTSYMEEAQAHESIAEQYTVSTETEDEEEVPASNGIVLLDDPFEDVEDDDVDETIVGVPGVDYPAIDVDFDAIEEENGDIVAWVVIPSVEISYPVFQGEDDEYYLHHSMDGADSKSGEIYISSNNRSDMTDMNTFMFGHNMKNGTMFGSLKKMLNEGTIDGDPYVYVFMNNGQVAKYHIFSYYTTTDSSDMYRLFGSDEAKTAYINEALDNAVVPFDGDVDGNILTLSTCHGVAGGNGRLLVHAVQEVLYN